MELSRRRGPTPSARACRSWCSRRSSSRLFRVLNGWTDRRRRPRHDRADHPVGRPSSSSRRRSSGRHRCRARPAQLVATIPNRAHRRGRHGRADHADVGHHLHHPAPADDQEHAGLGAGQPVREAAEGAALRAPARLRRLRRQLPDRCPHLLVHHQRVVDVPAVLRHPADAAPAPREKAYHARLERKGKAEARGRSRPAAKAHGPAGGRRTAETRPTALGGKRRAADAEAAQEASRRRRRQAGAGAKPAPGAKPKPAQAQPTTARRTAAAGTTRRLEPGPGRPAHGADDARRDRIAARTARTAPMSADRAEEPGRPKPAPEHGPAAEAAGDRRGSAPRPRPGRRRAALTAPSSPTPTAPLWRTP